MTPRKLALERLTVIDLTRVRAGPTCVRQLADFGANVIKVEARSEEGQADFSARHDPDFQNLHRNKRSITIDLKNPQGVELLKRLVARADVLVENYRPDVKYRLGIDYETLKKVNSRLVYASISGFGEDGPYKDRPGVDQIAQGMSGLMSITGEPGRGPMRAGIALADVSAGLFAALGILVALYERETSNEGQWVQASLLHSQIFMLDFQAARYLMKGEVPQQVGNNHPTGAPTGTFRTRDGFVNIAPTPAMWRRFCKAIDREDLVAHPDYASAELRRGRRAELNALIEGITSKMDSAAVIERMNAAGIPSGPIYSLDQTFADPQVQHLQVAQGVESKALGPIRLVGQAAKLSRTPAAMLTGAPEPGEQTDEILREFGFSNAEVSAFHDNDVV